MMRVHHFLIKNYRFVKNKIKNMTEQEVNDFLEPTVGKEFKEIIEFNEKEYHEYANLFPMIPQDELKILADDIKQNGLVNPIVLLNNKIIDGRNRYEACKLVNIIPKYITLSLDVDPLTYVISTNLKRRHLTIGQKADIAATLANMKHGGNRKSDQEPNLALDISIEQAAKIMGVSTGSVKAAREVQVKYPERRKEIQQGKNTVNAVVKEERKKEQIKTRQEAVIKNEVVIDKNLHLGNCVDVLKTLNAKSVDCVVMDPPYLIDYKDTRESFNPTFNDSSENKEETLHSWFKEIKRVVKDNAHIYCFYGMDDNNTFFNILKVYFQPEVMPLIWVKNNHTMCDFNKVYASKYEPIYFCTNGTRNLNYPVSPNILNFSIPTNKLHKTQKPIDLLEYLIENSTVEGEVVLDPFMGSGSTCLAAKNKNRKYIGIELEPDIYNIAIERLNKNE